MLKWIRRALVPYILHTRSIKIDRVSKARSTADCLCRREFQFNDTQAKWKHETWAHDRVQRTECAHIRSLFSDTTIFDFVCCYVHRNTNITYIFIVIFVEKSKNKSSISESNSIAQFFILKYAFNILPMKVHEKKTYLLYKTHTVPSWVVQNRVLDQKSSVQK